MKYFQMLLTALKPVAKTAVTMAKPMAKPLAVAYVTREINERQAKLDPNDKSDRIQSDGLEYVKHLISQL
jgi:hypothetical protein